MDPEFCDYQMELFCPFYPAGICREFVPEQDEVGSANNSKARRRRNKKKHGGGDAVMRNKKLSEEQASLLEQSFESEYKLESERKDRLAAELGLDPRQVAVWFQNRRARWKNKKLEEEYSKLKFDHATTVVEKCRLETELLQLKEQLVEAGKEIEMLSERRNEFLNNMSPSSSLSMEPPFLGEFVTDELDNVLYMPQGNYVPGLEWDYLYLCN